MRQAHVPARCPSYVALYRLAICGLALLATIGARRAQAQFEEFEHNTGYRFAFDDRATFLNYVANQRLAPLCVNTLDAVPRGFIAISSDPCATAILSGASVGAGRIESSTPFSLSFLYGAAVFGVDLSTPGSDVAYINVFERQRLIGTITRPIGGPNSQFLGTVVFGPAPDRFEIGTRNGSMFAVEAIYTSSPEPSAALLLTTGLLTLGGVGAVRRRSGRRA